MVNKHLHADKQTDTAHLGIQQGFNTILTDGFKEDGDRSWDRCLDNVQRWETRIKVSSRSDNRGRHNILQYHVQKRTMRKQSDLLLSNSQDQVPLKRELTPRIEMASTAFTIVNHMQKSNAYSPQTEPPNFNSNINFSRLLEGKDSTLKLLIEEI